MLFATDFFNQPLPTRRNWLKGQVRDKINLESISAKTLNRISDVLELFE